MSGKLATDELKYLVHDRICSEAFPAVVLFRCGFSLSSNIKNIWNFHILKVTTTSIQENANADQR